MQSRFLPRGYPSVSPAIPGRQEDPSEYAVRGPRIRSGAPANGYRFSFFLIVTYIIIQSITSSEMCSDDAFINKMFFIAVI